MDYYAVAEVLLPVAVIQCLFPNSLDYVISDLYGFIHSDISKKFEKHF